MVKVVVEDHWRLTNQPLKALIPCKKTSLRQEYWCKNEIVMAQEFDKLHYFIIMSFALYIDEFRLITDL